MRGRWRAREEVSLDHKHHQGWYGECFVRALAAAAGLRVAKPEPDVDGIDFHFSWISTDYDEYTIAKVQVKSWSVPKFDDQAWHYRLSETHFNALAGNPAVAAYLFLVVVPRDARDYTRSDPDWLHLSQACYWASLAGRPRFPDPRADHDVTVHIPRRNLLSVEALTKLCARPVPIPEIAEPPRLAGTA